MQKGQFDIKSENDDPISPIDPKSPTVPNKEGDDDSILSPREGELTIDENDMKKSINSHLPTNRRLEEDIENKTVTAH